MTSDTAGAPCAETVQLDCGIIGAGLYGIQAAITYLSIHPEHELLVFESSADVGGVWSASRIYDDFWTQTPRSMAEFSHRPLGPVPQDDMHHGFFKASYVTEYLETISHIHRFGGQTLSARIRVNSAVESLVKQNHQWLLKVHGVETPYTASRVIDASGLTSIPNVPSIPGADTFHGTMMHHVHFGSSNLLRNDKLAHVVVIGGAKSAADLVYAACRAGKSVSWVIRASGSGPCSFVAGKGKWLYGNSNDSFYTRMTGMFLASAFMRETPWTRLLYRTRLGRFLFARFWQYVNDESWRLADYHRSDGEANGYANLRPDTSIFWQNDSTSINQRDDFFDTVSRNVKVYRRDVERIDEEHVVLMDGTLLPADAILLATGWQASQPHISDALAAELGLPVPDDTLDTATAQKWAALQQVAKEQVLEQFPILRTSPVHYSPTIRTTPFRLYRGILPIKDRSIAFVGKVMLGNHFRNAEVQALWATAAIDGVLQLPTEADMEKDVARTVAWNKLRYLGKGKMGNWLYFDLIPYTDSLLDQLRLKSHRKSGWRDLLGPCRAADLAGLIEEYKSKQAPP